MNIFASNFVIARYYCKQKLLCVYILCIQLLGRPVGFHSYRLQIKFVGRWILLSFVTPSHLPPHLIEKPYCKSVHIF